MKMSSSNWNDLLVEVFEKKDIAPVLENDPIKILLAEKEIDQLEIKWLKEKEQYKIADGHGKTFFPDEDFSYHITLFILGNIVGFLLFCTVTVYSFPYIDFTIDGILSAKPELRNILVSILFPFLLIIASFIFTFSKMIIAKGKFEKAKKKYLNQRKELLDQLN